MLADCCIVRVQDLYYNMCGIVPWDAFQLSIFIISSKIYAMTTSSDYRDQPNHLGYAKFFYEASAEEREHALKLIEYQNSRGGEVRLTAIQVCLRNV